MEITANNIIIIAIVAIAIIGTIIFTIQKGIRPNSIIGKLMGKDGSCELKQCKVQLKPTNLYDHYCDFHLKFMKLSRKRNLDEKSRKFVQKIISLDASTISNSDKRNYLNWVKTKI